MVSSSWWWAYNCPKHVEKIISVIKHSVASSWFSSLRLYYNTRTNIHQNRPLHLNLSANCIRLLKMCSIVDEGISRVQKSLSSRTFYMHALKGRTSANHLSFSHPSHLTFLSVPSFHLYILSRAFSTCFRVGGQRAFKGQYHFFVSANNFVGQTKECSPGQSEVDIRL